MAKLHEKVINALRQDFGDVIDALDDVPETGRITGVVVSSIFYDMDHHERQELLDRALEKALAPDELRQVGPIATLTPAEATVKA